MRTVCARNGVTASPRIVGGLVVLIGVIESFDERRGDGLFVTSGERLYFHCVNIADGSRTIAAGSSARARRVVGHLGHDEVSDIQSDA